LTDIEKACPRKNHQRHAETHGLIPLVRFSTTNSGAEPIPKRAIDLNASYLAAHHWYARDFLPTILQSNESCARLEPAKLLEKVLQRQIVGAAGLR
jgi:hypothetical protein